MKRGGDAAKRNARIFARCDRKVAPAFSTGHHVTDAGDRFATNQGNGRAWQNGAAVARAIALTNKREHTVSKKYLDR